MHSTQAKSVPALVSTVDEVRRVSREAINKRLLLAQRRHQHAGASTARREHRDCFHGLFDGESLERWVQYLSSG
jgi:hypothetical protein